MKPRAAPPLEPSKPRVSMPENACDTHFHMVSDPSEYKMKPDRVEDPAEGDFAGWLQKLQSQMDTLGITRGVAVQSILYGTNNRIILDTIEHFGRERMRGVGLVMDGATGDELDDLSAGGIMGVRLNYVHGGVLTWSGVQALAPLLRERGMHVQMLINAEHHAAELAEAIPKLGVPVVFDHIGWPDPQKGVEEPGFQAMLRLVGEGHAWVKLSGVFRFCDSPYRATDAHIRALAKANPERCLWGSDWPYLMMAEAKTPDPGQLLDGLARALGQEDLLQRVLVENPEALYRFGQ